MPVFSLKEVRSLQIQNVSEGNFKYWNESAIYGYFGGGNIPSGPTNISTISRLNFSNETVSNPGNNLPSTTSNLVAVSSIFYGYFGGGVTPSTISTIRRLDFSNETVSLPGKNLLTTLYNAATSNNNYYGYFAGGSTTSILAICAISRFDFSTETVSDPGNKLPTTGRENLSATSSSSYGYYGGGITSVPGLISTISRLDFSNETTSNPGNNLPSENYLLSALSSNSYGYYGGGSLPSSISTITRLDFSNETVSNPGNNLPSARNGLVATSNNFYGYFSGGRGTPFLSNLTCTITRLDFSNETVSDPGNNLPTTVSGHAALSGGASVYRNARGFGTYGYFGGAYSGSPSPPPFSKSFVFRFDFSTEQFTPIGNLITGKYNVSGFSNKDSGYFLGGQSTPGVTYNVASNKISFSNETISSSTPTGNARTGSIGLNSKYCGYLVGGAPITAVEYNVTKFDYSNESRISLGNILPSPIASGQAGVDCGSYGYMTLQLSCRINRLDFSNETISNPGNNRSQAAFYIKGISHTSYGYFVGGSNPGDDPATYYNTFIRIDFSSETTSLPGKNLPSVRRNIATTQSGSYGYCVGGEKPDYPPPPVLSTSEISTISRIDFSTEDVTNIATNFPQNVSSSAGISNHNKYNLYS